MGRHFIAIPSGRSALQVWTTQTLTVSIAILSGTCPTTPGRWGASARRGYPVDYLMLGRAGRTSGLLGTYSVGSSSSPPSNPEAPAVRAEGTLRRRWQQVCHVIWHVGSRSQEPLIRLRLICLPKDLCSTNALRLS